MKPFVGNTVREERRRINEECLWCAVNHPAVRKGTIVNESATGALIRCQGTLEVDKKLYVLSIPGGISDMDALDATQIKEHPLTRSATVVRHDGSDLMGVHFYGNPETRPEFRRWFRGKCTVSLLSFPERCVFNITGDLTLESSALLQTLFTQQRRKCKEMLVSCYELAGIATTAGTVFRAVLNQCDKDGVVITLISGGMGSPCENLNNSVTLSNGLIFPQDDVYNLPAGKNIGASKQNEHTPGAIQSQKKSGFTSAPKMDRVLIVSRGQTTLNRLGMFFDKYCIEVLRTKNFVQAMDITLAEHPLFVVVDIDLENCESLIILNKIKEFNPKLKTPLLILGPNNIYELVKAASFLPVGIYLTKPYTERDYANAIQNIIQHLGVKFVKKK
jgi:ActR/RegA family two-component response regulator